MITKRLSSNVDSILSEHFPTSHYAFSIVNDTIITKEVY